VDDQRVGRIARALRRRLSWRQLDLALKAGCSQALISLVERGHVDRVSLHALRRILGAVDARVMVAVLWRAGDLDRLLDDGHARLVAAVATVLRTADWLVETEITYSEFGERGSYDLIAFHPPTRMLLVVETKTDFPSAEATLRKLDEKVRLATKVALERFGWRARAASRLLVLAEGRTARRRIERHAALLEGAFPCRSVGVRRWIAAPAGSVSGLWFVTVTNGCSGSQRPGGRSRVRTARKASPTNSAAAA
jgi:transcriptional regulator with XRE-family HTH domain